MAQKQTPRTYSLRRAAVAGSLIAAGTVGTIAGVSAANGGGESVPSPENGLSAPVLMSSEERAEFIKLAREPGLPDSLQVGADITGQDVARIYDIGVERVPAEDMDRNGENILNVLFDSSTTANTASSTPHVREASETYALYAVDLNSDGYQEYVMSLKTTPATVSSDPTSVPTEENSRYEAPQNIGGPVVEGPEN